MSRSPAHRRRVACRWIGVALLAVTGCQVGPDFVRPVPPPVPGYRDSVSQSGLARDNSGPHLAMGQPVPLRWWEALGSSQLNEIIGRAVASNQTLVAAQANLAQAREVLAQARGGYYPAVDASASAERQHVSGTNAQFRTTGNAASLFSVGADASYPVDLFGGVRRRVEQEASLAENAHYQLAAAYLTVTGNAVTEAITIASLREQLQAIDDILAADQKNLDLVQLKFEAGKAAQSDLLTAQSQLEADRTLVPPLSQQLAVARHALSILVGQFPSEWSPPAFNLEQLALAKELPVSVPSDLVHQRPDILAAEAELHAASAAIGVAQSQLYPSLTLSGSLATQASSAGGLFHGPSAIWNLLSGVTAPLFHGGTLRAQKRAAVDAYRASFAVYRQTVLSAFQQVADVLHALESDNQLVDAQNRALAISRSSLELQRLSYNAGKSSLLQLLDAERSYNQARLGDAQAVAQRFQDVAQLAVAMGGGWWQAPESEREGWGALTPKA